MPSEDYSALNENDNENSKSSEYVLSWMQEKIRESWTIELDFNHKSIKAKFYNRKNLQTRAFEGTTLIDALKSAISSGRVC